MSKQTLISFAFCASAFTAFVFSSCSNNTTDIALPEKETVLKKPVSRPLKFSEAKMLKWDTVKKGGLQPVVKKLDIDALPSVVYDSTGFRSFEMPPAVTAFNFNSLPDTVFNIDDVPSKPLQFKTRVFAMPNLTKVFSPAPIKGNPLALYDFGPKQGLPATQITSLLNDSHGLLWIGAAQGIYRYDGENIQAFVGQNEDAPAALLEDPKGRIWFINTASLNVIDLEKGTISSSSLVNCVPNDLSGMVVDNQGKIWVTKTNSGEVMVVDPETNTFKTLTRQFGFTSKGTNDVTKDPAGNIWINTAKEGIFIVNTVAKKIRYLKKANGLASDTTRAMAIDKSGVVWTGITGGAMEAVDVAHGTIKHYGRQQGLRKLYTSTVTTDDKGKIWVGRNGGVDIIDPVNNRTRFIDESRGLGARFMVRNLEDNRKRMWLGEFGSLQMIDQGAETVHPLGVTNVISLMEDTLGMVWVATQKGLQLIDPVKNIIHKLDKAHGLADDFVQSFAMFEHKMLVTSDGGLNVIDPIKKTIEHVGKKEGLDTDTVYNILKDKEGNTWFTGPRSGVNLVPADNSYVLHTDITKGLNDNSLTDAREDADGLVWLAGQYHGIGVIDLRKGTIQYLNDAPGLRDTCTKAMLPDKFGRMWIGTDKGVYVVDKKKGTITTITTEQGLDGNIVSSILPFGESVVAGGARRPTIITAPISDDTLNNNWAVANINKSEGLVREATNAWLTDAITRKGQYLFGDNGITIIHDIAADTIYTPTYITVFNLLGEPQFFADSAGSRKRNGLQWDSIEGGFGTPVNLRIPYNQNYMQFHFAQAHLSRQDITKYMYILEGVDKTWNSTTNTVTENYLNLSPGKYIFKVTGKGLNGKWSKPTEFSFTILPPWYKTWWAYAIYVLLGAGLLRAYIVYRSRKLQRENKLLEEKISLRTSQLQKSIEDLKATQSQLIQSEKMASLGELTAGIAHEIQNPLNFINNFSEVNTELIADMKEEIAKGNLDEVKIIADNIEANEQKINHHGKRADSIVKGMLQHSRTGNRQKEASNINAIADEYLRLAYHGLRAKDKSFNASMKTDFDEKAGSVNIISQDIGRVVLNLITNAFYTVAEKKKQLANGFEPTVTVSTKRSGHFVEVKVSDNGNGIPQRILDKIFQPFFTTKPTGQGTGLGLSLSYDIVKAHGGDLRVETKEGEGSTFTVQLPA